eukprot:s373_g13.t1
MGFLRPHCCEEEKERKHRVRRDREWKKTQQFLEKNDFDSENVNAPKTSWWGFKRSYPLHKAVMDRNWEMIDLLMKFGANPKQKDSRGKVAAEYFKTATTSQAAVTKKSQI